MQLSAHTLDRTRLEEHFSIQKTRLALHPTRWGLSHFSRWLVGGFLLAWLPALVARETQIFPLSGLALIRYVLLPFAFATLVTVWSVWYGRRQLRRDVSVLADQVEREHAQLAGPGWIKAALNAGIKLTLWVGGLVGALVAAALPGVSSLAERLVIFGQFVLFTAAWAIPFGFVIRWITLRSHERWRVH